MHSELRGLDGNLFDFFLPRWPLRELAEGLEETRFKLEGVTRVDDT